MRDSVLASILVISFSLFLSISAHSAEDRSLAARKKTSPGERRLALVIGNSVYNDAPLKNPVNDADAMASVLRDTGFEVIVHKNADRRKMISSIKEFGQKLKKSDVGLFYYAGHGVQLDSANYLLPVDLKGSDVQDAEDFRHYAFPLNDLMDRMRDASTKNIIILDACRDNPFLAKLSRSASRGLAKVSTPASTSILYSTDPGNTASDGVNGDNGVFTNRLVESIQKSGLELVEVMREVALNVTRDTNGAQRPVFDGVLSSKFYFRAPEATVKQAAVEPTPSAITVDRQVMELRYWESAEKVGTSSAYRSYLKKFPTGDFAELARERLEQINAQKLSDGTKAERDRMTQEKMDLERTAKEASERTRMAEERSALEQRIREAETKARQAENRSKQSEERIAAEQARLAEQKTALERLNAQIAAKPQAIASLQPDKPARKDAIKEKIGTFIVSDLTVTDEASGLIWVRNANLAGKRTYANALSIIDKINRNMFAGYDDWRMPRESDYYTLFKSLKSEVEASKSPVSQIINRLFSNYPDWDPWMFSESYNSASKIDSTYDLSYGTKRDLKTSEEALVLLVRGTIK